MTRTNPSTQSYEDLMAKYHDLNPYVKMREAARVSQSEIADALDMSEQVIRRLEYGLFNTANAQVSRELLDRLDRSYVFGNTTNDKIAVVAALYEDWQKNKRTDVGILLSDLGFENPSRPVTPTEFRLWVMSYLVETGHEDNVQEVIDKSNIFEFSKALSLHPYTVQRWETRLPKTKTSPLIPPSLRPALEQMYSALDSDLDDVVFARAR